MELLSNGVNDAVLHGKISGSRTRIHLSLSYSVCTELESCLFVIMSDNEN